MNDQDKSVLLARARGWLWKEGIVWYWNDGQNDYVIGSPKNLGSVIPNFYEVDENGDPVRMPEAWRMLNWASKQIPKETGPPGMIMYTWAARLHSFWEESHRIGNHKLFLYSMPLANAQRFCLDKVLSLAIKDGLIVQEETV